MANPFYTPSGNPATGSSGLSLLIRNEFASLQAGFDGVSVATLGETTRATTAEAAVAAAAAAATAAEATRAGIAEAANTAAIANSIGRNRVTNGGFRINQRPYSSGVALAAAAYGHDRWKAGAAGCTYLFGLSGPAQPQQISIQAGTLLQITEACDVEGGSYTLSWSGGAQGRIGAAAFGSSPQRVTGAAASTSLQVEFGVGTLGTVQLEPGVAATLYEAKSYELELHRSQRFFQQHRMVLTGYQVAGGSAQTTMPFPTPMRVAPTLALVSNSLVNLTTFNITAFTIEAGSVFATASVTGTFTVDVNASFSAEL